MCPKAKDANWRVRPLFSETVVATVSAASGASVASALSSYCVYEWAASPQKPDVGKLPCDGSRKKWLDVDPPTVVGLSDTKPFSLRRMFVDAFREQVDAIDDLPATKQTKIVVSVVDSIARPPSSGSPQLARFRHGYRVASVIRTLSCPSNDFSDATCVGSIQNPLALPRISPTEVDTNFGGYFGHQGELAAAIVEAVEKFSDLQNKSPVFRRHIINLSVGWSPEFGGRFPGPTFPSSVSESARAVYDALVAARCSGALIIAAAGNATGLHVNTSDAAGFVLPAAWERKMVQCADGPKRLLHAVGGVDGADRPLPTSRKNGMPELVAPAQHVTVPHALGASNAPPEFDGPILPTSGTSMAAAVTSAAAAIAWGTRPDGLDADGVMSVVRNAAIELASNADNCAASGCKQKRVSICETLKETCKDGGERCPTTLPTCRQAPAGRDARPKPPTGVQLSQWASTQSLQAAYAWQSGVVSNADCSAPVKGQANSNIGCAYEKRIAASSAPWVGPQPTDPPCPECFGLLSESIVDLYVFMDPSTNQTLTDVALWVETTETAEYLMMPPEAKWVPGATFQVTGIQLPPGEVVSMKLTYDVNEDGEPAYAGEEPISFY